MKAGEERESIIPAWDWEQEWEVEWWDVDQARIKIHHQGHTIEISAWTLSEIQQTLKWYPPVYFPDDTRREAMLLEDIWHNYRARQIIEMEAHDQAIHTK
jgi:hypothetical protein